MHVPRGIRLALVDDHPTLLNGLAAIFSAEPGYEIVGTGSSADEAREIARANAIDVMLIDLSMPGDVFAAIAAISRADEKLKVVVFTAFANVELALRALDAGALGFVIKGRPTNDLFDAIEAVLAGELYASPEFAPSLFRGYRNRPRGDGTGPTLTAREEQIIAHLLDAKTNSEIGAALRLSDKMLSHHMAGLKRKLHAKNRVEIVEAVARLRGIRP